jgi:uncharacterized membrane protein
MASKLRVEKIKSYTRRTTWGIFAIFAMVIGIYPLLYLFNDGTYGLLASKPSGLLNSVLYNVGFYGHIIFGGVALLIGWVQFNKSIRTKRIKLHRLVGTIYVTSVLISGILGFYIALNATGGIIAKTGFSTLAIIWLTTTFLGFNSIRKKEIDRHEKFMIYSYSACFAAVTLRIWLPLLTSLFDDFMIAYRTVSWLCWVPNLIVAFLIVNNIKLKKMDWLLG